MPDPGTTYDEHDPRNRSGLPAAGKSAMGDAATNVSADSSPAAPGGSATVGPASPTLEHRGVQPSGTTPADTPHDPDAARPGRRWPSIPGYAIEGVLGEGGMGVVYRARNIRLNRPVAIKMILAGPHANPEAVRRFSNEIEAIGKLQHSNIVQVYDTGQYDGQPYYVMELVDGTHLGGQLAQGAMPHSAAASLCEKLARAMQYAHEKGIIHRDLKPTNVLIAADGNPKIMDFGIAKRADISRDLTVTGAVLGTPGYLSPEQAEGRTDRISPATDVFSLGVILYEMLTGRRPFDGASDVEILTRIIRDDPPSPAWYKPGIPKDLETICLKCLQKNPARRYHAAGDLAEDLEAFRLGHAVRARRTTRVERALKWSRRHPGWASLIAMTALLIPSVIAGLAVYNARLVDLLARSERLVQHNSDLSMWVIEDHLEDLRSLNGATQLQLRLVSQIQQFLDKTQAESQSDPVLKRRLALAYERVADVLGNPFEQNLGRTTESIAAYRTAIQLLEEAQALAPGDAVTDAWYARCLLKISDLVTQTEGLDQAEQWIQRAAQIIEKSTSEELAWHGLRLGLCKSRYWLAWARANTHQMLDALADLDAQLEKMPPGALSDQLRSQHRTWLAENWGRTESMLGNHAMAKGHYVEMLRLAQAALAQAPRSHRLIDQATTAMINVGDAAFFLNELDLAEQQYQQALADRRALCAADENNARFMLMLSIALERIGKFHHYKREFDKAVPYLQECIAVRRQLVLLEPGNVDNQRNLWIAHGALGETLNHQQLPDDAEKSYLEALAIVESVIGEKEPAPSELEGRAEVYLGLGSIYFFKWMNEAVASEAPDLTDSDLFRKAESYYSQSVAQYDEIDRRGAMTASRSRNREAAQLLLQRLHDAARQMGETIEDTPDPGSEGENKIDPGKNHQSAIRANG